MAPVLDHVNVEEPPLETVVGLAESVTVGGAPVTITATLLDTLPPAPEQDNVNVVSAVIALITALPEVVFEPLQPSLAVQPVVFVLDQLNVVEPL